MPSDDDVLTWDSSLASNQKWAPATGGTPAAEDVTFTPAGTIAATDVQAAIEEVAAEASGAAGVEVKDAGSTVGTRSAINFIEGSNVTLTIADDAGNDEVDVTIASTGGGGGGGTGYMVLVPTGQTALDHPKWPNTGNPLVRFLFIVPPDWDGSSDFTVNLFRRSSSASGTTVMTRDTYRQRDATAPNALATGTAMNFTPGDTNTHLTTFTYAAANFAIGDTVRMDIPRASADGADTNTGFVDYDGGWVEYTKA